MSRRIRVALACLFTLCSGLVTVPARAAACPPGAVTRRGHWTTIRGPAFPATIDGIDLPSQRISDYAVDPVTPSRIFVTNGRAIMRTTDGGCTWKVVYALGAAPSPNRPYAGGVRLSQATVSMAALRNLAVAPGPAHETIFAILEEGTNGGHRPHVLASRDGGASWATSDSGLPPHGYPRMLVVAAADPSRVYLVVHVAATVGYDRFFASHDGGVTWDPRSDLLASRQRGRTLSYLTVDPLRADEVYAWGINTPLYVSLDGTRSFAQVSTFASMGEASPGATNAHVGVVHPRGRRYPTITVLDNSTVFQSSDGGITFTERRAPLNPDSLAHGATADVLLLAGCCTQNSRVVRYVAKRKSWVDITPAENVSDLRTDAGRRAFYVRGPDAIHRYTGPVT